MSPELPTHLHAIDAERAAVATALTARWGAGRTVDPSGAVDRSGAVVHGHAPSA